MKHMGAVSRAIEEALLGFPWLDPHTHLDAHHLSARGLDDILLYHMSVSDLRAAGCPDGARLSEDRSEEEARARVSRALPYVSKTRNTSIAWGVRMILADLYNWSAPLTDANWPALHDLICARSRLADWPARILQKANIARLSTELWRGHDGRADHLFDYALEWTFFSRTQRGEPDIPLYELERAWSAVEPGRPIPVNFDRRAAAPPSQTIRSVEDVRRAVQHYCDLIPYGRVVATATHLSTEIDYSDPDDDAMSTALACRAHAGDAERDVYASYVTHRLLEELERRKAGLVFQFSLGAEPLPFETSSLLRQRTIGQVAELVGRYPGVRFMCFLGNRAGNQGLCTLARELPNLSLAGYWWHNFFPGSIRQVMEERLDMLPLNKQIGFFSDAYCVEWTYAKAAMVRKILAQVLTDKVALGQYTMEDCVAIGRGILCESARDLLGMRVDAHG
ncbi:MAG TPA: hypothetical protein PLO37_15465 [Candidatus Hydrogenedentes bacterium]|nr:hypothetical protein [Candidatus Hydrogenedentota bacterium]HPG68245.1 hypothetical protein [Candidatus Hydrogenedentota bacterium]